MSCNAMFLNLLSQVEIGLGSEVLANAYHQTARHVTSEFWVLAQTHCAITGTAGCCIYSRAPPPCKD